MSRDIPQSRYDLSTYSGRVLHTIQITDPRTLLTTSAQLSEARALIARYTSASSTLPLDDAFWHAKKVVDASCHPETGRPILLPFRMSSFVLTNLVVTAGMLTPNLGTRGTLFWQVTNQSVNVAFNYCNANKSSPLTGAGMLASYLSAVVASCSVAVGLNAAARTIRDVGRRELAGRLVPFVAVAGAGALNVCLMRGGELRSGIDIFAAAGERDEGAPLGRSRRAAVTAVWETAASRVLNAAPIMVLPPLVLLAVQRRTRVLERFPRATLPLNLATILATSLVALPLAIGAFATRERLPTAALEDGVREAVERRGVSSVVFNRGM